MSSSGCLMAGIHSVPHYTTASVSKVLLNRVNNLRGSTAQALNSETAVKLLVFIFAFKTPFDS